MTVIRDVIVPTCLVSPERAAQAGTSRGDLHITGTQVTDLRPAPHTQSPRTVIPALTEAHCHLDKCHSIQRLGPVGGDLATAIARQFADKAHWTEQDLATRARRGLDEAITSGCGFVRSHVDWGDAEKVPLAWHVLSDLSRDCAITVQGSALTNIAQMADPAKCTAVARVLAQTGGALGAFIMGQPEIADGIRNMFAAATQFSLPLDFHVDESLGDFNGLEIIADTALAVGFEGPILCGHAVSLANRSGDDLARLIAKIHAAGITVCALPTTNLYLQDRGQGTPDRRGLTRLRELHDAGVPVIVGSDNVGDAFCPTGQHDPMAALHLATFAAHLDPPMERWLAMVTTDAARAVGAPAVFVSGASVHDLRISAATNTFDLVAGRFALTPLASHVAVSD